MDRSGYLESLRGDAAALLEVAAEDLGAPVPACPGWTVERLAGHLGRVYRWTAGWVGDGAGAEVEPAPAGAAVVDWTRDAAAELAGALERADPEATVSTWMGEQPAIFWPRRMAVETALHRWDTERAVRGVAAPVDADLAVEGVEEAVATILPLRAGEGLAALDALGATVHLHSTDVAGEWLLTFVAPPEHLRVARAHAKGDVAARGTASDLLLFLWNRAGPDSLEVFGDRGLLERWPAHVKI